MIFQSAFLASLLCSAAAVLSKETSTLEAKDVQINELKKLTKAKTQEKLAVPFTLSAKLEKFSKITTKPSTINLETTTFDESPAHLRGLKMKNNFLKFTNYGDDWICSTPSMEFGSLVNTCMNYQGENSGIKKSVVYKVNNKEHIAIEIQYDGYDCKVSSSPFLILLHLMYSSSLPLSLSLCSLSGYPFQGLQYSRERPWLVR
jgi:hypothetical protein